MIKLKSLLTEAGELTQESVKIYWNFALSALIGRNPDHFYRSHHQEIDAMAAALAKKYGPTSGDTVYRGIILDPSEVQNGKVHHDPQITYVSFSEDKKIAIAFGDIENPMAEFMMQRFPTKKGYLITADYRPDQVLFHYKWITAANLWPAVENLLGEQSEYIKIQKEVITKPKPYYRVEPVLPGASGGIVVGK